MGEYADDYYRKEVKEKFGFDPGSMYTDRRSNERQRKKSSKGSTQSTIPTQGRSDQAQQESPQTNKEG
jgi:hypothetical protein